MHCDSAVQSLSRSFVETAIKLTNGLMVAKVNVATIPKWLQLRSLPQRMPAT